MICHLAAGDLAVVWRRRRQDAIDPACSQVFVLNVCVCARRAGCDDEGLGQDHAPGGVVVGLCLQRPSPSTGI